MTYFVVLCLFLGPLLTHVQSHWRQYQMLPQSLLYHEELAVSPPGRNTQRVYDDTNCVIHGAMVTHTEDTVLLPAGNGEVSYCHWPFLSLPDRQLSPQMSDHQQQWRRSNKQ